MHARVVEVVSNPYDFTRPISDPELLAGRKEELERVTYYLDQAVCEKPKYYNIALIGKRASGKTSLLNVVRHLMSDRGILTTRIILNTGMISSPMQLYREIVDGILTEGQKHGMYGGPMGWLRRRVKRIHGSADIEISIPGATVRFTGGKDPKESEISQQLLVESMQELLSEAKKKKLKGIAILLDECDLLAQDISLLQKLRNVSQSLDGYIFVFTGTEEMLPSIDKVFSPLGRSFIKVEVTNFSKLEQTMECITKPLSEEERKLVNTYSVAEIHSFTGGSPYEITLVAHHMYRRHRSSGLSEIRLTVEVLEDVFAEIDRLRSETHREFVSRVKGLYPPSLKVLVTVLSFRNSTAEELAWYMLLDELTTLTEKTARNTVDYSQSIIRGLVESGILLSDQEHRLSLVGDAFNVLYLKYFALSQGVRVDILPEQQPIFVIHAKVNRILTPDVKVLDSFTMYDRVGTSESKFFSFSGLAKPASGGGLEFVFSPGKRHMEFFQDTQSAVRFRINIPYMNNGFVVHHRLENEKDRNSIVERARSLKEKFRIAGIDFIEEDEITLSNQGIRLIGEGKASESIELFQRAIVLNPNLAYPLLGIGNARFALKEYAEALQHCETALIIEPGWSQVWELKGRCFIHMSDSKRSIECYDKAIEYYPENWVAWDNKARALMSVGEFEKAAPCLERVVKAVPGNVDAVALYFEALMELKSFERALEVVEQAFTSTTGDIRLSIARAQVLLALGRIEEAMEQSDIAISIDGTNASAWYNKACALSRMGEKEQAIAALGRAAELYPPFRRQALSDSDFAPLLCEASFKALTSEQSK